MSLRSAWLFALALTSACSVLSPQGPSEVARGEYYAAGRPEFDTFFIQLHEQQVALLAAPNEPADARKNVTQALGLAPDASDDSLKSRLDQELKKLASQGLRLRLDVPEPSQTLDASATLFSSETSTVTPFRALLPQEASRLVRSRNRLLKAKADLDQLRVNGITLEGNIDTAFRTEGPWKRDEVRQNLSDGQKVITLMQARAQQVVDQDEKLLDLLRAAATTDPNLGKSPGAAPPPPPEEAKPTRRTGAARPVAAARPAPAAAGPAAKPAPAKPSARRGGDDEAAAPKPVQGNAPAEIEP
ncbi:MAG TPA: hypothetical protein VHB79_31610 [Polyangiaceae bacterium]|nr:hypothetical protein [Polyangiaceae bacterium]